MSGSLRVFVNGRLVPVAPGAVALDAVALGEPELAPRVRAGTAYLTDGRGIRVEPEAPLRSGEILRIVVPARRGAGEGTAGADT